MSITDELQKLAELYRSGAISSEEFEIAKRQVLAGAADATETSELEELRLQVEKAQVDQRWQVVRESYGIFE